MAVNARVSVPLKPPRECSSTRAIAGARIEAWIHRLLRRQRARVSVSLKPPRECPSTAPSLMIPHIFGHT